MTEPGNGVKIHTAIGEVSASGSTVTNVLLIIAVVASAIYMAASLHMQSNMMRDQHDGIREAVVTVKDALYAVREATDDLFIGQMVTEDQKRKLELPAPMKKKVEEKLERKAARIANQPAHERGIP